MNTRLVGRWIGTTLLLTILVFLAMAVPGQQTQTAVAGQAQANDCMGNQCNAGSPMKPCTASDVTIAILETWQVANDDYCLFPGDTGTFYFRAQLQANSNLRYDPGMWIATDGGDANLGNCYHDYLQPPLTKTPSYVQPFYGWYLDAEDEPGSGDECGDIAQGIDNFRVVGPVTFPCTDANGDGIVDPIGTCLAWDNNTGANCPGNNTCPGTGSKCRCTRTLIEVNVGRSDLALVKAVLTPPVNPGDEFTYTLQVANNGLDRSTGFVIVDNLDKWLRYVSYSGTNVTCSAAEDPADPAGWGQIVTCHVTQDLLISQVYSMQLTVQLHDYDWENPPDPGDPYYGGPPDPLVNEACVTGNEWDAVAANNCDDADVAPTAVVLRYFKARGVVGAVKVGWETTSEVDNVGFNLYRGDQIQGVRTKLNNSLIPTQVPPGSPFGATYLYRDRGVQSGKVYFYWLEDVDIYGRSSFHGPVRARVP